MTQEINDVELFPEFILGMFGQAIQPQCGLSLFLSDFKLVIDRDVFTTEYAQGEMEKVFHQFAFPCVPDLRVGTAYVGNRQEKQGHEVTLIPDDIGKMADRLGIGQVFFLGNL